MNKNKDIIFLASQSASRKQLLSYAAIPFKILDHTTNEKLVKQTGSFYEYILAIAQHKMNHVLLPSPDTIQDNYLFVLTADSLTYDKSTGIIFGKPKDMHDARRMLKHKFGKLIEVATGCCLEKKIIKNNEWITEQKKEWVTSGEIEFLLSDQDIDVYLKKMPEALYASGAGIIENFGLSFLKSIRGSYTAVMGLPLYELRQALTTLSFKF